MKEREPGGENPAAAILRFPRKRGRPRASRPSSDTGTPELVMKRLMGETTEALDLCFERGILTREQHWCGVHLRWLYTLRYGAPGVRAVDPTHLGGIEISTDDPEWRAAREQEYHEAVRALGVRALAVLNLCVYNERPKFLARREEITAARARMIGEMIGAIREGLDLLAALWGRKDGRGR